MRGALLLAVLVASPVLAGCISADVPIDAASVADSPPFLGYTVAEPDLSLILEEFDIFLPAANGVEIHVRVVKPVGEGPFPVIAQFTPYTAPGQNVIIDTLAEPVLGNNQGTFENEFVRRGYAFAYADVRGTGDSTGCLDLRGAGDIADLGHLTETLGTASWSNGKVGFIGASYPGSEAHMAAIANNEHLAAVIPVVASTSFYHYHHNDGVPYTNHGLGSTNTGYTQNAAMPTLSPQNPNYVMRTAEEATCPNAENMFVHGGLDQTGAYYDWWVERNLRSYAVDVKVPVLMAQGLADWNVKPDHIATWFNDLSVPKTLIAGQWGHAYPYSPCKTGQTTGCDNDVPYGNWWAYATSFFDTYLMGIDTGMFQGSTAWVQDNDGAWHRSASFPLADAPTMELHFQDDGTLAPLAALDATEKKFYACPSNKISQGAPLGFAEGMAAACRERTDQKLVFETAAFETDTLVSGVPLVELAIETDGRKLVHLTVVMECLDKSGKVVAARENYGYLNPVFRNGLETPTPLPGAGETYPVIIDLYPQEDLVKAGESLRFTIAHADGGRTIEVFEEGWTTIHLGGEHVNRIVLPLRPMGEQGTRL